MERARACSLSRSARLATPANAYLAYVSNEKGNSITIIDTDTLQAIKTVKVGRRPRGVELTKDGSELFICAGDDDSIQVLDTKTLQITGKLPSGPDPELMALSPDGKTVYVSNENDNLVTMIDTQTKRQIGDVPVGVEPEGMAVSPDGNILVNTSETTNMAHMIDTHTKQIIANILVDARPRFAQFKPDGSELWVSSEVGGTVAVIDPVKHVVKQKISFEIPGLSKEAIQPIGISFSKDGKRAFVALGPANRVAAIDAETQEGRQVSAGRPARLASRFHAGRKISADRQWRLQRRVGHRRRKSQGGEVDSGRGLSLGRRGGAEMSFCAPCSPSSLRGAKRTQSRGCAARPLDCFASRSQ